MTVLLLLAATVAPRVIEVGTFYNGATVKVEGAAEDGANVLVTVVGPEIREHFRRKGRYGPIWLNAGDVQISGVPSLFLRFSTEPVRRMLARESILRYGFDREALMRRMHPEPGVDDNIRGDFMAVKETDGTYAFGRGGIRRNGHASFLLEFHWPRRAPPGSYEVRTYVVRDGAVIRQEATAVDVVRVGFPAWMQEIADSRPSLYGMVAVLIGALAGFGIDFLTTRIFRRKPPA